METHVDDLPKSLMSRRVVSDFQCRTAPRSLIVCVLLHIIGLAGLVHRDIRRFPIVTQGVGGFVRGLRSRLTQRTR